MYFLFNAWTIAEINTRSLNNETSLNLLSLLQEILEYVPMSVIKNTLRDKGTKITQCRKIVFNKWCFNNWTSVCKIMHLDIYTILFTKFI